MSEWSTSRGDGPIIATAIHAGHDLRPEVAALITLSEPDRLREEDPYTDQWLWVGDHTIDVSVSRFEVDLNRPRDAAVYRTPDDAWGLELWKHEPGDDLVARSLERYDAFYASLADLCDEVAAAHDRFVVLDLHSYNHRRGGPDAPVDDPAANPEINVGTGTVDHAVWGEVITAFSEAMAEHPFDGGHLDVRENVRFQGGHMSGWLNDRYAGRGCALAIEMKKIYMDEWTGKVDESALVATGEALSKAAVAVRAVLLGVTSPRPG
jgi:N-formylglutamate amidohydrolase